MTGEIAPGAGPAGPTSVPRRLHLDGVRTVAVYLVVAFHAGVDRLSGGFVGVDVFFVLSGYLVTELLLREMGQRGRVDLWRFYSRRARRLLPAAALVLLTTAIVFPLVASPAEVIDSRATIWSAPAGVANWVFLSRSTDYFAADVSFDPVLHFWSLAVEEQFYLVWPWLLLGLRSLTRGSTSPRRTLFVALGALTIAGAGWAAITAGGSPIRGHFATDARAYQLLAGAVLATVPWSRWAARLADAGWFGALVPPVASAAGLTVVLATSTSYIDVAPSTKGMVVSAATVVWLAGMELGPGPLRWLMSRPTMGYLGRISYGTYLWHWLVVIVADRTLETSNLQRLVLTAAVASGLAALSAELVELPIRTARGLDRRSRPVVAVAVSGQVLLAAIVVPSLLDRGVPERGPLTADGAAVGTASVDDIDWEAARQDQDLLPHCRANDVDLCRVVEGGRTHVVLIGDSHANMLVPTFRAAAEELDLSVSVAYFPRCPWPWGVGYLVAGVNDCFTRQDEWYTEILPELDPDIVVAAHRIIDTDPEVPLSDRRGDFDVKPSRLELLRHGIGATAEVVSDLGARLLVIEPIPIAPGDGPAECLSQAERVEECRFVAPTAPSLTERLVRDAAEQDPDGMIALDIDGLVCPYLPICDPVVDGRVVMRDDNHLTVAFARSLGDDIATFLRDQGWGESR